MGVNLLTYSEAFDNSAWQKANCSATADTATDPNSGSTAETMVESGVSVQHLFSQPAPVTPTADYTWSAYLKANVRTWALLKFNSLAGGTIQAYFNLGAGTLGTVTNCTAAITAAGNGYYRCSIAVNAGTGVVSPLVILGAALGDANSTYSGTSNAIDVWGGQLEPGTTPSAYDPVTAGAARVPQISLDALSFSQ